MDEYEEAVLFTYALLESRLNRLEYILSGAEKQPEDKPRTLTERIQRLERSLQALSEKTALLDSAQELLSKHKDLLKEASKRDEDDAGLDAAQKAAMVVERAPGFATAASQLKALDDQQVPQTDGFTKLASLRPRIAEAEDRQLQQAMQISLLRKQSGLLVSRSKQIHFLGQGRCWAEWDKRLIRAEQSVRRAEFRQKQDEDEQEAEAIAA